MYRQLIDGHLSKNLQGKYVSLHFEALISKEISIKHTNKVRNRQIIQVAKDQTKLLFCLQHRNLVVSSDISGCNTHAQHPNENSLKHI
jgi:hypothetical protein